MIVGTPNPNPNSRVEYEGRVHRLWLRDGTRSQVIRVGIFGGMTCTAEKKRNHWLQNTSIDGMAWTRGEQKPCSCAGWGALGRLSWESTLREGLYADVVAARVRRGVTPSHARTLAFKV